MTRKFFLILIFLLINPVHSAFAEKIVEPYTTKSTTIGTLMDDPKAAAIVKKYIPAFSDPDSSNMARAYTLYSMKNMSQGKITNEILDKIDGELIQLSKSKSTK